MRAKVGDWLIVNGAHVDERGKRGRIVEVRKADGDPPYLVRWLDGGETLVFPGPDAHVMTAAELAAVDAAETARLDRAQHAITGKPA